MIGKLIFTLAWWKYLFEKPRHYNILKVALCRARGHPDGVVWYNPGGLEPDMHCRNCGDDLG